MVSTMTTLREQKKAQVRDTLRREALRLFSTRGYDATTVDEIAAAAGVSHMTFFRYFPTKEDVVLMDEFDPMLREWLLTRPADEAPMDRLRGALVEAFREVYPLVRDELLARMRLIVATPQLRARLWEQQVETERYWTDALTADAHPASQFTLRVVVAACLAGITVALLTWAEDDGRAELPDLFDAAFIALRRELGGSHGNR
jgi:AcrR family transcriptional regulator